jgi:hypothetical protein
MKDLGDSKWRAPLEFNLRKGILVATVLGIPVPVFWTFLKTGLCID